MGNKKNNLFTCFLALLLTTSCSSYEEIGISSEKTNRQLTDEGQSIQKAKEWYEKQASRNAETRASYLFESTNIANWEEATTLKLTEHTNMHIRVPLDSCKVLKYPTSRFSNLGYRDIVLREEDNDNYMIDIIEIRPDTLYLKQKMKEKGIHEMTKVRYLVDNHDFTGYFFVYNIANIFRYGEKRVNGKVVSRLEYNTKN